MWSSKYKNNVGPKIVDDLNILKSELTLTHKEYTITKFYF